MSNSIDRDELVSSYTDTGKCQLSELVQYQCEVGSTHIECNPFVRLFLRCPNKPMIEVTPEYNNSKKDESNTNSVLPDFGAVVEKKSPPGFVMMDD
ncbi:uncharacterized protein BX664DRAFT_358666 [Halteromyces radiatus]|uniref:uncharacterized protein n=1 Tax=Halteromyces radiatus TaxID=101107 RepID=UPI0022200521|nr:uncharacterized protein BX664DRAFT_358666 [Halteromyces radiatus]KAI8089069.1 hypothetical protein BX664DRAFT_358666 [Halteromyces radiatus]